MAAEVPSDRDSDQHTSEREYAFAAGRAHIKLHAFRREFQRPSHQHRNRESESKQQDDEAQRPDREIECREDGGRYLQQQPSHREIARGNLEHFAFTQFRV